MEGYQRVKIIGKGSFGSAILVRRGAEHYVLKEVNLHGLGQKEKNEAAHEAAVLKSLRHYNIIAYIDSGMTTMKLWIVMDYASEGDLEAYVAERRKRRTLLEPEEALGMFVQICSAIKYIHEKKILHRDLKSKNIFLAKPPLQSKLPWIKVGDFGIAKVLDCTKAYANTQIGILKSLLTDHVSASSAIFASLRLDSYRADSWALGIILFECLALHVPFDAPNLPMLAKKITTQPTPAIPAKFQAIPGLPEIVSGLLQKDPGRRPVVQEVLGAPLMKQALEYVQKEHFNPAIPKPTSSVDSHPLEKTVTVKTDRPSTTSLQQPGRKLPQQPISQPISRPLPQQVERVAAHGRHNAAQSPRTRRQWNLPEQYNSPRQHFIAHQQAQAAASPRSNEHLKAFKARMKEQNAENSGNDIVWLNGGADTGPTPMEIDTLTPNRLQTSMKRRPQTPAEIRQHYYDQRLKEQQEAQSRLQHIQEQPVLPKGGNYAPSRSHLVEPPTAKDRAQRLHQMKSQEQQRQKHRDLSAHHRQAAPKQQAAFDPYAAAREAYLERQRAAIENAKKINQDLGRAYVAPSFASSEQHDPQPNDRHADDSSIMMTDEDHDLDNERAAYVELQPLGRSSQPDDVANAAEAILRHRQDRKQKELQLREQQLEAARKQNMLDRQRLAQRIISSQS